MMMQHKRSAFEGTDISGYVSLPKVGGGEVQIRASSISKRDNAAGSLALRIDHLHMASRSIVERISKDERVEPRWYCLRVMSGREFAVEKLLDSADVECLVVKSNPYKTVRRKRVCTVPARPVIVGYVLVRCFPFAAAIMGLLRVDYVLDVIGGAASPWAADRDSIIRFKEKADAGKYDHKRSYPHSFLLEEEVRVCDGPFASFKAIVIALDDERFRVKVEVGIFGRATPVELDIDQIEKV